MVAAAPFAYVEWRMRQLETLDGERDAPQGENIVVDGLRIHYEVAGEGEGIVLIHGFGGSTYSWRLNIGPLATAGYRVYAIDLPGFGFSERTSEPVFTSLHWARLIREFLRRVGIPETRTVVIGNSMGGAVALRFAVEFLELTRGLVLTAPAVNFRRDWGRVRPLFNLPVLGPALIRLAYYVLLARGTGAERMIASAYGDRIDQVTSEMRERMLKPLRVRGSAASAVGLMRSVEPDFPAEVVSRINCPILIVAGAKDRAVPLNSVEKLHAALSNSRLAVLPEAGHLVQEDEPDEVNRLILEFIQSIGASP
jgi:pimeloyl-ACP methyl ester carboxylesterase